MRPFSKYRAVLWFVGGLAAGLLTAAGVLRLNGLSLLGAQRVLEQQARVTQLEKEIENLTEDLFRTRLSDPAAFLDGKLPYEDLGDERAAVAAARAQARATGQFLMITFGANWCLDCRTLHHHLQSQEVSAYTRDRFLFVNVDVGKFNRNRELAAELGVDLTRGIPVAIFFDPTGRVIGATNEGQLEPARYFSSKQILQFVRDIAERSRISAPDAVH